MVKWILEEQASWYTACLFWILLIFPIPVSKHTLLLPCDSKGWITTREKGELNWEQLLWFFPLFPDYLFLNTRKIKIIVYNSIVPILKSFPFKTWLKIPSPFSAFSQLTSTRLLWVCPIPYSFIYLSDISASFCKEKAKRTKQYSTNSSVYICAFFWMKPAGASAAFFPWKCLVTS